MGVRRLIGFALVFCVLGAFAKPVDLLGCFADAAENDPTYQSQVAIYLAQKQAIPEAVSAVLPQVTLSAAIAREYEEQGQLGKGTFRTNSYGLLANQTLFNVTQFQQIKQAKFSVRSAFATLSAQQQDLMSRTAKGYLDVLQAHDLLRFTKEQKRYIAEQLQATKTLFEHHDATITDLEQAQGAVELINAEFYSAQIALYDTIQALSEITSIRYQAFSFLNRDFPLIRPDPEKLETWVQIANAQNWYLQASRLDIGVAREALNATRGNFLPSVSATGGFTKSEVPSLLLVDSVPNNTNNIGLNANWNFFQGGTHRGASKCWKG